MITRVAESPVFKRKGDNLEVEVPVTIVEAIRGATIDVPILSGSKKIRVPAGHPARHGAAAAGRGPTAAERQGPRRHPLPPDVDVPQSLSKEQKEAVDELASVMNGNPRERLFGEAKGLMARRGKGELADPRRGVYMISVAAELAGMHPQTLRIYESRGLITPQRSAGQDPPLLAGGRRRLRRIQELTSELGMNLAGVEKVFELEEELERMRARMERLQAKTTELPSRRWPEWSA